MCDIVLLVYDQLLYTKNCVESILKNTDISYRLLIVDNGSVDNETIQYLDNLGKTESGRISILRIQKNIGYVKAVNYGLEQTSQEFVCVMSNDTLAYPGWLTEMIAIANQDSSIGIVNPQWDPPKRFRGGRDQYFIKFVLPQKGRYIESDWARGFCYLTKRCVIDKIGGLDLDFSPAYFDDWDYSMRAKAAGYRCVVALGAFVFHFKNVTYSVCGENGQINALLNEKAPIFYKRWGKPLKLLIVDDGAFEDIKIIISDLLRNQNKVVLLSFRSVGLFHTNLMVVRTKSWLIGVMVFFILVDNARHSLDKRFDLVLGREKTNIFIKKFIKYLFNYNVEYSKENFMLNQNILRMKF